MEEFCSVNLEQLELDGQISCPYCGKGRIFLYGATGKSSQQCANCRNIVLWDFDKMHGYRAKAKKTNNRL